MKDVDVDLSQIVRRSTPPVFKSIYWEVESEC